MKFEARPENGTVLKYVCDRDKTHQNWFVDLLNEPTTQSYEVTCTNDSKWRIEPEGALPFCKNPHDKECETPEKFPGCQDRTVRCNSLPFHGDFKRTQLTTDNFDSFGAMHKYTCRRQGQFKQLFPCFVHYFSFDFPGWLFNVTGYPESVTIKCVWPSNYPHRSSWYYEQWLDGLWAGEDLLTGCFDPTLCYHDPPKLPLDNSITTDLDMDSLNRETGSQVFYKCTWTCK